MLRRVQQLHDNGCFIACVATLLEISYQDAFNKLFPGKAMPDPNDYGSEVGLMVEESLKLLPQIGLQLQPAKLRNVKSLRKRTSLIVLRWKHMPDLSHATVFDGNTGNFLDPAFEKPSSRVYNSNLHTIYYIKRTSHGLPIQNTDIGGHQSPSGLSDGSGMSSSQTFDGDALFV